MVITRHTFANNSLSCAHPANPISRKLGFFLFPCAVFLVLFTSWFSFQDGIPRPATVHSIYSDNQSPSINMTLGFNKIFVLSLPSRTDRQDALQVMSSITGFTPEISFGVRGDDVDRATLPPVRQLSQLSSPTDFRPIRVCNVRALEMDSSGAGEDT